MPHLTQYLEDYSNDDALLLEQLHSFHSGEASRETKVSLALHPLTPLEDMRTLSRDPGYDVRKALALRELLPREIFEALLEYSSLAHCLAMNQSLEEDMMLSLCGGDTRTHRNLSLNRNSSNEVLYLLAGSSDKETLYNVMIHPHSLGDTQKKASDNKIGVEESEATQTHHSQYQQMMSRILADDLDSQMEALNSITVTDEIISICSSSEHDDIRQEILMLEKVPYGVLKQLSKDSVESIREEAKRQMRLLPTQD